MVALLDVNILIALLDADHTFHDRALDWFTDHAPAGWASCPITENGCIRIMAHPGYPNALPISAVVERLAEAAAHPSHEFWADDLSLLDPRVSTATRIHGAGQLTDLYLLALVVKHAGQFITFDRAIDLSPIKGADGSHILRL